MRKLYAAILIGGLAVLIDFLFHYVVLEPYQMVGGVTIDFLESPAYFAVKFLVFSLAAYIFLAAKWMVRLWGPIIYGAVASASFGAFYYFYPQVSVGTGSMPVGLKGLWGLLHAGCGTVAAGAYERNWFAVIIGLLELATAALLLVLFGPQIAAVTVPGY